MCHFVSFVMCISGAGVEERCFNVFGDVADWVLCCSGGAT